MSNGRVMVGFDGSPSAWRALDWTRNGSPNAAECWMWSLLDAGTDVDPSFVALEERVIPDAIADVPIAREAAITATVPRSNPATALIEQALGAAALVVGTRGRGRLMTSMLGSVSHDVLLNVPCPVLVTPKECSFASDASRGDEAW